jgi:hypothetical protein
MMSQMSSTLEEGIDRSREIAEARSQLAQLAEEQGVLPVDDPSHHRSQHRPAHPTRVSIDCSACCARGLKKIVQ